MINQSLERALEMKRLRAELKQCPPGSEESERRWARIDELLDKHLDDKGVHPADCDCTECLTHVADALAHRLGEASSVLDLADPSEWGPAHLGR
jgi:hypothetical protein